MVSGANQHNYVKPYNTGTSVVKPLSTTTVLWLADNLTSYGFIKIQGIERLHKVGKTTMVGISRYVDVSDMQYLLEVLDELIINITMII